MNKIYASILLVAVSTSALSQASQAPAAPPKDTPFTFGGYMDFYYLYDFGRPHTDLNDRLFDIKHDLPTLAEADFDILKAASLRLPFGLTINLIAGKSADILHSTEPGGVRPYEYVGQAYVTFGTPGKKALTIDAGQFYTWIGYEGYDSRTQDNYSRSFENTLLEPDYHLGVRASYPLTDKLTGNLYLVNGWNEDVASHNGKSWGATLSYSPSSKLTLTAQNYSGPEGSNHTNPAGSYGGIGFPIAGVHQVNLLDFIASYQISSDMKLVFDLDYASASGSGGGKWDGETLYLKKQLTPTTSGTLRVERVSDTSGLRTGNPVKLESITATYDVNWPKFKNLMSRFELREDFADSPTFPSNGGTRRQRTTLTFAEILHF